MANNIYSFALHREIRAEERRAPGQELFAERGRERIQSPPCWSLTCAQVRGGGAEPRQPSSSRCEAGYQTSQLTLALLQGQQEGGTDGGGTAGKANFRNTF